jgi:hypothetical protein
MTKRDLKKELQSLYRASGQAVTMVEVPRLLYLQADGQGDPNTVPAFQQAVETLFKMSYTLKFKLKKEQGLDYGVMPLEGLWSADDPAAFAQDNREAWKWTLMILQPEWVTQELLRQAGEALMAQKGRPRLYQVRLAAFCEGLSAQILHVGPYAEEAATISRLHAFIREKGYHFAGPHHEIYLGDPRRTDPARLKTILRQPVALDVQR